MGVWYEVTREDKSEEKTLNERRTVTAFLQEHWEWVTLIMGIVSVAGSIRNWNWMCDPTGKPYSHRYGRGSAGVIFFLLGLVLIVTSIWSLVPAIK